RDDGSLERVRFTGKTVTLPTDLHVSKGAIALTFAVSLDTKSVDRAQVSVEQWNYRWTQNYGSKGYSVAEPDKGGRGAVTVKSVKLSADGKTLTLAIPELKPVMQMGIYLKGLKAADGTPVDVSVFNTINYVP